MPKSRIRRRSDYTPPGFRRTGSSSIGGPGGGGRWVVPTMLALLLLGLAWIVVYYLAGERVPAMAELGGYNILIGMGLICAGFVVSTRWR